MPPRSYLLTAIPRVLVAALLAGGLLTACGGGGSSTATTTSYVTGIVASGAPLLGANAQTGATVTLTDSSSPAKTVSATTNPNNGAYTINVTGLTLPFVLHASGISGDALLDLTSMVGGTGAVTGQTLQVDLTPLTNAIAAMMSSTNGDPIKLTTADVHSNDLSGRLAYIRSYVAGALTTYTLGYAGDPISTAFSANDTGYDAVLDNLAVIGNPNAVTIYDKYAVPFANLSIAATATTAATTAVDDTGEFKVAPTSANVLNTTLGLTANTDYTIAATRLDLNAITLPANNLTGYLVSTLEPALNSCFKSTSPSSTTCASLVNLFATGNTSTTSATTAVGSPSIPAYLNDGTTASGFYGNFVAADTYVFDQPSIQRYVTPTEAIIHVSWTRSDGIRGGFDSLVVMNSSNVWQLVGNQHQFSASIQPVAEYRQDLNTTAGTLAADRLNATTVGLDIQVKNAANIMWAKVTGAGLGDGTTGNGAVLIPQSGCGNLVLFNNNATDASSGVASSCDDSYYRLATSASSSNADYWSSANVNYSPSPLLESALSSISLFQPYVFRIHYCSSPLNAGVCTGTEKDAYYVARLSTPVPTIDQAKALSYPTNTTALSAFAGGSSMSVTWTPSTNYAPPVDSAYVQMTDGSCGVTSGSTPVPFSASFNFTTGVRNAAGTASVTATSGSFPAANTVTSCSSGLNMVKLNSHRKDGLQIRSVVEYANY